MNGNWIASYRLQLHAGFPLKEAQQVLPYLADLGISHVYLSPCLQAVPGSQHGYDVTDPTRISEDLGGESAEAGELTIEIAHGRPRVRHYENTWPLGPASWGRLLSVAPALGADGKCCFGELERLQAIDEPDAKDRTAYASRAAQAE